MELDQNFQFLVVALVYIIWRLTSDMSDVTGKVGNIFCPLEKKKVKTSKTEKRLVKMVSENNFCNSASKLMKQNLLVGVILDQNCIQILDATLNDLFFSKTCFIKSSLNMPRT